MKRLRGLDHTPHRTATIIALCAGMFAANLGLLYELTPGTRLGLTWNSQVDLDFDAPAEFSNLAPGLSTVPVALGGRGDLVGSYDGIATLFLAAYFNWMF